MSRAGEKYKGKAVVVGGSVAGVSCAHALIRAGWEVLVVEKSISPKTGSPTGAGLGLDPLACRIISSWLGQSEPLNEATMPLTVEQNQEVVEGSTTSTVALSRDENFNFRAALWADLHSLLVRPLPEEIFLWGHLCLSFRVVCPAQHEDGVPSVIVKVKSVETGETADIVADLLVAADGCRSPIRQTFLPHFRLRYSGYCAWRGVLDFTGNEEYSEVIMGIRKAYPDIGTCLYFDLGSGTHTLLFELPNSRMNWVWFVNQPEPQLKGNSVTVRASDETAKAMHEEADKFLVPEFAALVKATREPFVNAIYDAETPGQISWDNVVLVGDAAHPTTPHCARSTNMSILDAAVLGKCLEQYAGLENLQPALQEYQSTRLPVVRQQVLHARYLGRLKQGLESTEGLAQDCRWLQQNSVPFFDVVPSILRDDYI